MNIDVAALDTKAVAAYTKPGQMQGTVDFLLNVIPSTVVDAFAKGEILPVLLITAHKRGGWRGLAEHGLAAAAAASALLVVLAPDPLGWWSAIPPTLRVWDPVSLPTLASLLWATMTQASVLSLLPVLRSVSLLLGAVAGSYLCLTTARRAPAATAGYLLLVVTLASPVLWPWYFVPAVACLVIAGGRNELLVAAAAGAAGVMNDLPMPVVQMQRVTALSDAGALVLGTAVLLLLRRKNAGTQNLTVP